MSTQYAMYMLINKDLNMKPGKIASQCCHATRMIMMNLNEKSEYVKYSFNKWEDCGFTTIVLFASEDEMNRIQDRFPSEKVIDSGRTEIPPNSFTVLGVYPKLSDGSFDHLKLVGGKAK